MLLIIMVEIVIINAGWDIYIFFLFILLFAIYFSFAVHLFLCVCMEFFLLHFDIVKYI